MASYVTGHAVFHKLGNQSSFNVPEINGAVLLWPFSTWVGGTDSPPACISVTAVLT